MNSAKKVSFYTLGCKLNYAETSTIGRIFEEQGYEKVDFDKDAADVYVINTCSVTENADKKCKSIIRKALRQSPNAKVAVIGCYAQLQPESIAKIPGVDLVLGASEKFRVEEYVAQLEVGQPAKVHTGSTDKVDGYAHAFSAGDRTRTFLKVQDGCDYGCTFCTIPLARGKSRSLDAGSVLAKAREVARLGVKEIVLTGVNIGDFGKGPSGGKEQKETFLDLIRMLDEVDDVERIRISSIEPNLLSHEIIEFVAASRKFMPHFHIPLQSGSNKILKLMRRRYLRELYEQRVETIKAIMPDCCIGVDVIVGFPGEKKEDFLDTYRFLNELDVSYLHIFSYSERPDTLAMNLQGKVAIEERRNRSNMLRSLSVKKRRHFYRQHIGEVRPVLFESEDKEGWIYGFTDNYIKVKQPFHKKVINQLEIVQLEDIDENGEMNIKQIREQYSQVH